MDRRRRSIGLALLALGCTSFNPAQEAARRLPLAPCTVEGLKEKVLCGDYAVWEDREARQGRRIRLHVVVLPALAREPAPDPLVVLAGGPGDSAANAAADHAESGRSIRRRRDIVLVDQRGTGSSHRLDCPVPGGPGDLQGYLQPVLPVDVVRRCRQELAERADLRFYTTSIAADDLDELRAWLGYQRINLEGGSYGTRAAQVYMRRHPGSVRTAVLVGTVGMDQHLPLFHARDGKRSTDLLLAACRADASCGRAFPRLGEELAQVLSRLEREPASAEVDDPQTGRPVRVTLSRDVFAEDLRFLLYTADSAAAFPFVVHRAFEGDFRPFVRVALRWETALRSILAFGMHLSVTCAEDVPFLPPEEGIAAAVAGTHLGDFRVRQQLAACREWPRGEIPAAYHEPVTAQVPTLLVSGELDPVTPPSWAEQVAARLPQSLHLVLAEGHHGPGGLSHPDCLVGLVADFLERGTAEGLDTSCVSRMKRPPFITDRAGFEKLLGDD
jgi:pimeloyl-ACP methyl ester carboxylesterase